MEAYEEKIEEITILNWTEQHKDNEIAIKKCQKIIKAFIKRRREERRRRRRIVIREKELVERKKLIKKNMNGW